MEFKNRENEEIERTETKRDEIIFSHKTFAFNPMWRVIEEEIEM